MAMNEPRPKIVHTNVTWKLNIMTRFKATFITRHKSLATISPNTPQMWLNSGLGDVSTIYLSLEKDVGNRADITHPGK